MEPIINDPVLLQEFLIESEELLQAAQRARNRDRLGASGW